MSRGAITEAVARISRLRLKDQAEVVSHMNPELQTRLLGHLSPDNLAEILGELEPGEAVELCMSMVPGQLASTLDQSRPEVAADILRGLPDAVSKTALENMTDASEVIPLLDYRDDQAGGLMTPHLIALRDRMTVSQAVSFVRRWAGELRPEEVSYMFVVDSNGMLRGGISLSSSYWRIHIS